MELLAVSTLAWVRGTPAMGPGSGLPAESRCHHHGWGGGQFVEATLLGCPPAREKTRPVTPQGMLALSLLEPLTTFPPLFLAHSLAIVSVRLSLLLCALSWILSEIAWTVMGRLLAVRHCACCCRWVSKKGGSTPLPRGSEPQRPFPSH